LLIENNSRIDIVNSNANIKDEAKYRACQLAKTNACFYVDDDWDIRIYIKSLYSHFLLEPTILHAITDQFTYFTNLMWTFFDESIDLHTGFSWIGCGSVFSRDNAMRHLMYMDFFLNNDESRDLIPQGDQFFSIWMNQIPAQFNGRLLHSDEDALSSFENDDFELLQYRASVMSIQTLETTLRSSSNSNLFQRKRASNTLVTYTKSPSTDIKRGTRTNLPHIQKSPYRDSLKFFETFNTANTVDNNNESYWKMNRSLRYGDLYGIDFQTIQTNHGFQIFRFIKFMSLIDDENSFHICEIRLIN
ncbi:unnamed protein product, partial [Rotaria sp. Silwood1]